MRPSFRLPCLALTAGLLLACDSGTPQPNPTPSSTAGAPPTTAPVDSWVTHTSKEGGFTVRMPGTPTIENTKVPTAAGDFELHTAGYEVPGRDVYLAVMWSALPPLLVEVGDTEQMLSDGVEGMLKSINGQLDGPPKHIELEHHPGREVSLTASVEGRSAKARGRMYVVHDRLFQILVAMEASQSYDAEIDKLFASFTLTPEFAAEHAEVVKFDWKPYTAPDAKFTASFPVAAPRVETETSQVDGKDVPITTITGSAERSYTVFMIGHFDVPGGAKGKDPAKLFELGRNGAASSASAKLVGAAEPSPLGKLPGEKYKLESEGGLMTIDARSYLDGNRFYFLMALRPRNSKVEQAELDKFFAGFAPKSK